MAALKHVDQPGYAALILRRTFVQLSQPGMLIPLSARWMGGTDAIYRSTDHEWMFPSGARIRFGHVEDEQAIFNYQGGAYQFIGFDELTQFSEGMYEYIAFSRGRRDVELERAGVSVQIRATANPGGVGHQWVKNRFVDEQSRYPGVAFIPAKVADNPGLDVADYTQSLSHLGPVLRAQLLAGDWGAFEGAAFTVGDTHLIDAFTMTNAHTRFEALDYGLNGAPWALWTVDYEGNLICFDLLYEKDLIPSQLAPLVQQRRRTTWGQQGQVVYADPSIWHRTGTVNRFGAPAVLADEFADNQLPLVKANNDPRAGMIRIRELLRLDPTHPFPPWHSRAGQTGAPRVFFVRGQTDRLVAELQTAQLQPIHKPEGGEKIDPDWESRYGHAVAMCRYAVMSRPAPSTEPASWAGTPAQLRDEWLAAPEELRAQAIRERLDRVNEDRRTPSRRTERV